MTGAHTVVHACQAWPSLLKGTALGDTCRPPGPCRAAPPCLLENQRSSGHICQKAKFGEAMTHQLHCLTMPPAQLPHEGYSQHQGSPRLPRPTIIGLMRPCRNSVLFRQPAAVACLRWPSKPGLLCLQSMEGRKDTQTS